MIDRKTLAGVPARSEGGRGVHVVVEIPGGSRNKYEIDKATGLFRLDRYLYSSSHYPGDYGFIPQTLAEDGDALDILVMVNEATFTGCLIVARVVGLFRMTDRHLADYKLLAVPQSDPLFDEYTELKNVPRHFLREVENFFATYKHLEGNTVVAQGWDDATAAMAELEACIVRFAQSACAHENLRES